MPAPTNSDRIAELQRNIAALRESMIREETSAKVGRENSDIRMDELRSISEKNSDKLTAVEQKYFELIGRFSVHEERIRALEKHTDRTWQVWLALGAAITALLVAFLKK